MSSESGSFVVAVAGPVGSGKTALTSALAEALGGATTIHFDRYETLTHRPVEELRAWLEEGADPAAFDLPELCRDLAELRAGAGEFVIFEMPFGREHPGTADQIDFVVWIDVPLDLALARKMREFVGRFLAEESSELEGRFADWLAAYLDGYMSFVGKALRLQRERVRPSADVVIDGERDPHEIAAEIAVTVRRSRDGG